MIDRGGRENLIRCHTDSATFTGSISDYPNLNKIMPTRTGSDRGKAKIESCGVYNFKSVNTYTIDGQDKDDKKLHYSSYHLDDQLDSLSLSEDSESLSDESLSDAGTV